MQILNLLAVGVFLSTLINPVNADNSPTISPGDVISADFLEDIISEAASSNAKLVVTDLEGEWDVEQSTCLGGAAQSDGSGLCNGGLSLEGLIEGSTYLKRMDKWRISLDSEDANKFTVRSDEYNFLFNPSFGYLVPNDAVTWECELAGAEILVCLGPNETLTYGSSLGCQTTKCRLHVMMNLNRFNNDEISFSLGPLDTQIEGASGNKFGQFNHLSLIRSGVVKPPQYVRSESSTESATLSWEYPEEANIQFEVFRKDGLFGIYSSVGIVSDTEFVDTDLANGVYWYRVFAKVAERVSRGSNVTKVSIP